MVKRAMEAIESVVGTVDVMDGIDCHHNYVTWENYGGGNLLISRKGAIQARKGTKGIIPGARGAMSFIVEGLGNVDSYNSASHGAGRTMSHGGSQGYHAGAGRRGVRRYRVQSQPGPD